MIGGAWRTISVAVVANARGYTSGLLRASATTRALGHSI